MTDQPTTDAATKAREDRDAKLRLSYGTAQKRLREAHLDEFNNLRVEEAKKLGVEWTPPKTEEQKAKEKYDALIAEFPHLANQSYTQQVPDGPAAGGDDTPTPVDPTGTGSAGPTRI